MDEEDNQVPSTRCLAVGSIQIFALHPTSLRPTDMRLTEKYLLYFIRAHAMFDFDFISKPVFPNNLM
jgi:hypothetical protein